jgi:hypothetical protein
MKRIFVAAIIICSSFRAICQPPEEQAIRQVLSNQVAAWNAGNIDQFMKGYFNSDSLMFIGKNITYGWQRTLDAYKKSYPDTAAMGRLSFDLLKFQPLSPEYYFVVGKWHLRRSVGDVGGYFNLLFQKVLGQWLIIVDHSS